MEKAIRRYWPIFCSAHISCIYPWIYCAFCDGVYLSFCKFTTVTDAKFIGFSNYLKIFTDASFVHALWYTAIFTVVTVVLINVLAFAVALLFDKGISGDKYLPTVFFMPNLIGGIILGYIWQLLLNGVLLHMNRTLTYSLRLWLLGTGYSDVLAADRLYDDHLHCRNSEYPGRSDRGCKD